MISVWVTFEYFLSRELFGIQERYLDIRKTTKDLLGGIEVSYTR